MQALAKQRFSVGTGTRAGNLGRCGGVDLDLYFKQPYKDRMRALLAKARKGTLTAKEQVEIDNYERVGQMLSLMKSKARRRLKGGQDNGAAPGH